MKQPKKLTYEHKRYLSKKNQNAEEWGLLSEDKDKYVYINKVNGKIFERQKN